MNDLPELQWDLETIARHGHHHHRFDAPPAGPGAEMETSRGCPFHCTFCAKDNFRNSFRRRPLEVVARELDGLIAEGVEYVYFIDEIFLPFAAVLEMIARRQIKFGIQTRIDLWSSELIDLLGKAGCVSIEAGVESITEAGRNLLAKRCKLSTDEITGGCCMPRIVFRSVQANLLDSQCDDPQKLRLGARICSRKEFGPINRCLYSHTRAARLHAALGATRRFGLGASARNVSKSI